MGERSAANPSLQKFIAASLLASDGEMGYVKYVFGI